MTDYTILLEKYEELKRVYDELIMELESTKEHLKRYTAPSRKKTYYENHKEELKEKSRNFVVSKEKKKEYNRRYAEKKAAQKQLNNAGVRPSLLGDFSPNVPENGYKE